MDLYAENILYHFRNPSNKGEISGASCSAEEVNPLCGDKVKISVKIAEGKIEEIKFMGEGCAISQAAASLLTEKVLGMATDEIENISNDEIFKLLGVEISSARVKCAVLALVALKNALKNG
ncbi:iron-sulfur cluster assembly scaffold protein [Pseudomonadota bacterium]